MNRVGVLINWRDIQAAMRYPECHEEVTRRGTAEPCNGIAVAVRIDPEGWSPYPVCARHVRAPMVQLDVMAEAGDQRVDTDDECADRVAVVAETLAGHRNLADGSCACGRWEVPQHDPWLPALEAHAAAAVVAALGEGEL